MENRKPFVKGVYWTLEINDNAYYSVGNDYDSRIIFSLWGAKAVTFEISLRGVNYVNDLIAKVENKEKCGNIIITPFLTQGDQFEHLLKNYGEI